MSQGAVDEEEEEEEEEPVEAGMEIGEEETPTRIDQIKARAKKVAKGVLPQKGGALWRLYVRRVQGIHVYAGIDPSVYEPYMTTFAFLGLSHRDIIKMVNLFIRIDSDKSGSISIFEYLMAVDIDRTPFSMKIFSIFDSDESDDVDFVEFVLAMWNFCSLSADDLCGFAFRCFARKRGKSWELGLEDCEVLVDAIYGDVQCKERRITMSYLESRIQKNGHFPFAQWKEWTKHNGRALFPIFDIQRRMRRRCLGNRFWKKQAKRRMLKFGHMDWMQIERRLEAAAMIRKRRVINMKKRDYKYLDDLMDQSLNEDTKNTTNDDLENKSWTAPDQALLPKTRRRRRHLPDDAIQKKDFVFKSAKKAHRKTVQHFQLVEEHGYRQLVPQSEPEVKFFENPSKIQNSGILVQDMTPKPKKHTIPLDTPLKIKQKPFKAPKRTRAEAIAILKKLKHPPPYTPKEETLAESKPLITNTHHRDWIASGRAVAKFIQSAPPSERLKLQSKSLLSEPSALERASGMSYLGHLALSHDTTDSHNDQLLLLPTLPSPSQRLDHHHQKKKQLPSPASSLEDLSLPQLLLERQESVPETTTY